jgi:PhzF family phenazine biosynthesis protein
MKLKIYQVDAFASEVFKGNPAAVCMLDQWPDERLMQQIAGENNLSETAFAVRQDDQYEIRWFTPETEVDLCGHATLATAHVMFRHLGYTEEVIRFHSPHSGKLSVEMQGDLLVLDFPVDEITETEIPGQVAAALNKTPLKAFRGRSDLMLVFASESEIAELSPDFSLLKEVETRGVIVTSMGRDVDFVSRFFAPQTGINEDPVTGSAHTTLTPYWSRVLGKKVLKARQLSSRGGDLVCRVEGDRVKIAGSAVTYMEGEIYI